MHKVTKSATWHVMKKLRLLPVAFLLLNVCYSQVYNRSPTCGTDTIHVHYRDRMRFDTVEYYAFECTRVGKAGLRFDFGPVRSRYDKATENWLGNHAGAILGAAFVHDKFNIGIKMKVETNLEPGSELVFNGDTVPFEAKLNPIRLDFYAGYSLNLKFNFTIEPYVGVTRNVFYVINEEELNKEFSIPKFTGLNTGITLNKYFRLKEFQFLSIFLTYGYGFANFKKINSSLGSNYSEWNFGLAYKVFAKNRYHEKIY